MIAFPLGKRRSSIRALYTAHLATAVHKRDAFLTNDRDLLRVREVPILLVDQLR